MQIILCNILSLDTVDTYTIVTRMRHLAQFGKEIAGNKVVRWSRVINVPPTSTAHRKANQTLRIPVVRPSVCPFVRSANSHSHSPCREPNFLHVRFTGSKCCSTTGGKRWPKATGSPQELEVRGRGEPPNFK